ncbi:hypothetical protein [Keratinibaculum paraultunense]|uniref:hypothetical protein n=1 Tax=Keratinibaculum paraultunense TaxID=1278232 RepID=UPI00192AB01E|nr:hypothetical protein [Keratinibaculum paraultunense]QQY79077.1 hypothetical protein JL105_07745 [Keratinibaculum paraultunense]
MYSLEKNSRKKLKEISKENLIDSINKIMDMSEQKIIESISEDDIFIYTISRACPTSFLACC